MSMLRLLSAKERQVYDRVCAYIERHATPALRHEAEFGEYIFGGAESRRFIKDFAVNGWLVPHWPEAYGGLGATAVLSYSIREAMSRAGIPHSFCAAHMAGDVLIKYGSQHLRDLFLARIARGEIEFAVGYSEPGAGSDMLSLKMKAEDCGDHYLVNGQKVFNTHAHQAEYHWLAVRTDQGAPNHKAISILLVDLDSPGISVRPMITIAGSRTNEVFYTDVRVPKSRLVGEVNKGFTYILGQLARERLFPPGQHFRHFESIVRTIRRSPDASRFRQRMAQTRIELEASRLLYERCATLMDEGKEADLESSLQKLFMSDCAQKMSKLGLDASGAAGFGPVDDQDLPGNAVTTHLANVVLTIYGGASEIQKNIIAQRGLGLPRIR
ncbi:MAG TPA: acyl-CoA dehydrogenase family protein [Steroidobacteraceae bacterium]|nr:acyl-CoA dehydrogenase family protein [Steroidobacteraceae bacterium]